jgi:acetyl esterase/lipase
LASILFLKIIDLKYRRASLRLPASILLASIFVATAAFIFREFIQHDVLKNLSYGQRGDPLQTLDIYQHAGSVERPTLIYFHGGGWVKGRSKDDVSVLRMPFFWAGWNIVNVEYRDTESASAPAALEDALCATSWIFHQANRYHFDTHRIVAMGYSAGGLLALATGSVPQSAGFAQACDSDSDVTPRPAAIIDWAGISDVNELTTGDLARPFAIAWIGAGPDAQDLARRVSPITYVGRGLPPTFMVHGDADPVVPFSQSTKLQAALNNAAVPNYLWIVSGGRHVEFGKIETVRAYAGMMWFLHNNGIQILP